MTRAVLLDAMGTLVGFAPPWPALRDGLAAEGVDVSLADAERAVRAEIGYYRANLHRARDEETLAALRADCAAVVAAELPATAGLDPARLVDVVMASFAFRAFPEAAAELAALRERGVVCVVCSNWDVSLHQVLRDVGLDPHLAGVITSAELGVAKPDPAPFLAALALAGDVPPAEAVHVGDSVEEDVAGARAAGVRPVLVDRDGVAAAHPAELAGVTVRPTLAGLAELVG
jgi:putative hydrolase of the HAD superfamily